MNVLLRRLAGLAGIVSLGLAPPLFAATAATAALPGRPDARFGDGGIVTRNFGTEMTPGRAVGAVPGPQGTTLVLQPGRAGVAVARYLPDGRLDRSFGDRGIALDPRADAGGRRIYSGPDGTILVCSSGSIIRFTADGKLDRNYGRGGEVALDRSLSGGGRSACRVLPDGSTIVSSASVAAKSPRGIAVVRYLKDGRPDRNFGHGGRAFVRGPARYLPVGVPAAQGQDTLVTAEGETHHGFVLVLARLDARGSLDPTFGAGGVTIVGHLHGAPVGLVQEADGAIVVAVSSNRLVRFTAEGRVDPSFGAAGVLRGPAPRTRLHSLVGAPNGDLVAFGSAETGKGPYASSDFVVERLGADGELDPGFRGGASYATASPIPGRRNEALAGAVGPGERLLAVGEAVDPRGAPYGAKVALAALEPDGTPAAGFGHDGLLVAPAIAPSADAVTDLLVEPRGAIVAAGHAHGKVAVVRFSAGGGLDRAFARGGVHLFRSSNEWSLREGASLAATRRGGIVLGPGSSGPPGVLRLGRGGRLDRGFGTEGAAGAGDLTEALGVAAAPGGRIVATGATKGYARILASFGAGGESEERFGRGGTRLVNQVGAAGYDNPVAVGPDGTIAALSDGGVPTEYTLGGEKLGRFAAGARRNRAFPQEAVDLTFDGDELIAFGQSASGLAVSRTLPDGLPDRSFGDHGRRLLHLGPFFVPGRVAVEPDGHVLVDGVVLAHEPSAGGHQPGDAVVVRFDADGALDRSFGADGIYRGRSPTTLRLSTIGLGPRTVTVGGTSVAPGSDDLQMLLLRLGR